MNDPKIIAAYFIIATLVSFYVIVTKFDVSEQSNSESYVSSAIIAILLGWAIWPFMLIKLFPKHKAE